MKYVVEVYVLLSTDVRSELDMLKQSHSQQEISLVAKERESVARMQAVRDEEWQKHHKLESEK